MASVIPVTHLKEVDPKVKDLAYDKFSAPASAEAVDRAVAALLEKKYNVQVVDSKEAALAAIVAMIPDGASVHNGSSTSLQEIGFTEFLKTTTKWDNVHGRILAEPDQAKSSELRRTLGNTVQYYLTSVIAVTEQGEFCVGDLTGTRVGPIPHSAGKVVILIGANKIVKDMEVADDRAWHYAMPLESARARIAYAAFGVQGSYLNNYIKIHNGNPFAAPGRFNFIVVRNMSLGY